MSIHTISSPEIPFFRLVQSVWQIIISLSTGSREIPRTLKRRVRVVGIRQPFDRSLRTHGTDTLAAPSDGGGLGGQNVSVKFLDEKGFEFPRPIRALKQNHASATAVVERRTYLVNDTSFVEVPVGLDAVWDLEIAGVAARFRGGALRRVYTIEAVSFCVGFADTVGEAVWELWRQCWKWNGAGCGRCVLALGAQWKGENVGDGTGSKKICWLTIVGFGDHGGGRLRFVSVESSFRAARSLRALSKGGHLR